MNLKGLLFSTFRKPSSRTRWQIHCAKPHAPTLGESRSHAVRRVLSLERSLCFKEFDAFDAVMQEYFDMRHAEPVPTADLDKPHILPPYAHCEKEIEHYHQDPSSV